MYVWAQWDEVASEGAHPDADPHWSPIGTQQPKPRSILYDSKVDDENDGGYCVGYGGGGEGVGVMAMVKVPVIATMVAILMQLFMVLSGCKGIVDSGSNCGAYGVIDGNSGVGVCD